MSHGLQTTLVKNYPVIWLIFLVSFVVRYNAGSLAIKFFIFFHSLISSFSSSFMDHKMAPPTDLHIFSHLVPSYFSHPDLSLVEATCSHLLSALFVGFSYWFVKLLLRHKWFITAHYSSLFMSHISSSLAQHTFPNLHNGIQKSTEYFSFLPHVYAIPLIIHFLSVFLLAYFWFSILAPSLCISWPNFLHTLFQELFYIQYIETIFFFQCFISIWTISATLS